MSKIQNIIYGLSGLELTEEERNFFKDTNPLGFILFKRNCSDPDQIKNLVTSLKDLLNREDVLILIDQEGGRVARLTTPHFRKTLPAKNFGDLAKIDFDLAKDLVYINHLLIGRELKSLGINVDCAPVADVFFDWADKVIGDRSFSDNIQIVIEMCKIADLGLRDAGVQSIIKHIPGHGRADKDSHHDLPIVNASLDELNQSDFAVFKDLSDMKMAMTAHVIYEEIDDQNPVTVSSKAISFIRDQLNFEGLLVTDDLSMKALTGSLKQNAIQAIEAGCDILLHCNGKLEEMQELAEAIQPLSTEQLNKIYNLNSFIDYEPYDKILYAMDTQALENILSNTAIA
jgi:beta-N-acetylhexosaminidase